MNLSRNGRRTILGTGVAFFSFPGALGVPALLISKSTNSVVWMVVLLVCQVVLASVFDLAFAIVVRREMPGYPLKAVQYTPAQAELIKRNRRWALSKWPYFVVGFGGLVGLSFQVWRIDELIDWLLLTPTWTRVTVTITLSLIGIACGFTVGTLVGQMRIRSAGE